LFNVQKQYLSQFDNKSGALTPFLKEFSNFFLTRLLKQLSGSEQGKSTIKNFRGQMSSDLANLERHITTFCGLEPGGLETAGYEHVIFRTALF